MNVLIERKTENEAVQPQKRPHAKETEQTIQYLKRNYAGLFQLHKSIKDRSILK